MFLFFASSIISRSYHHFSPKKSGCGLDYSNDNLSTDNSNENKPLDTDILDTAVLDKAEAFIKANDFIQALDLLKSSTITLLENERTYLLLSKACEGIGNKENSEKFYKIYATLKNLHK